MSMSVKSKLVFPLLLVGIISVQSLQVFAYSNAEEIRPEVRWVNCDTISLGLSIDSNGKSTNSAAILGKLGTTAISAVFKLERENSDGSYTTVKTWNASSDEDMLFWSQQYYVERGHTYRLKATMMLTRNGVSETITQYISEVANW